MHAHAVLMLAATALVGLFVVIVVAVTLLQRRGRLGEPGTMVPFASYGPVIAAACSGGAAAVHLFVVGEHASLTVAEGSPDAVAFLCSIGAGTTHFSGADPSLAGFLPLGVLSIGAIGAQGALAVPRVWRHRGWLLLGLAVTAVALAVAVLTRVLDALAATTAGGAQPVAYTDALAIVFDVALLVVIGLLAFGRPRALVARLRVSVIDAWVGTGLGVGAVAVFTVAGFLLAHATH
ncbi:MAG TPA: hypothetical protein VE011_00945 [Candidatus Dormibacteraeota bacterium]|nr:hypothetical protein [Candidatus Dormibacteraeota bacterium]